MQQLPVPANTTRSEALGINGKGQMVGLLHLPSGLNAVIWENGTMADLNNLTLAGSPHLLYANDISDAGEIVGEALDPASGDAPAYRAVPLPGNSSSTPAQNAGQNISLSPRALRQAGAKGIYPVHRSHALTTETGGRRLCSSALRFRQCCTFAIVSNVRSAERDICSALVLIPMARASIDAATVDQRSSCCTAFAQNQPRSAGGDGRT